MSIKLTPVVFLAFFFARRDWRALAVAAASALAFTGIGFALTPRDSVIFWTEALRDPSRIGNLGYPGNQSLNGALHRIGLGDVTQLVWFAVCAVLGLSMLLLLRRLFRHGHDAMAAIAMALYALIASPVSWGHHWTWSVPAIIVLSVWAWRLLPADAAVWVAAFAGLGAWLFLQAPHWLLPFEQDATPSWSPVQHVVGSSYLWWALAALVVVWVVAPKVAVGTQGRWPPRPATTPPDRRSGSPGSLRQGRA